MTQKPGRGKPKRLTYKSLINRVEDLEQESDNHKKQLKIIAKGINEKNNLILEHEKTITYLTNYILNLKT